jgi:hypothetical protein
MTSKSRGSRRDIWKLPTSSADRCRLRRRVKLAGRGTLSSGKVTATAFAVPVGARDCANPIVWKVSCCILSSSELGGAKNGLTI